MELKPIVTPNGTTLQIEGRIDSQTAHVLDRWLDKNLPEKGKLTLDLTDTEYVSSAGLRVILRGWKLMETRDGMVVKGANRTVREVFRITGLSGLVTIE